MAYFYGSHHNSSAPTSHSGSSHGHPGSRRRAPRLSQQNSHRPFRGVRSMKELTDAPAFNAFRVRFEACKGFDLDDDLEFCPALLGDDDLLSVPSSASDRSSLSSGSPSSSPLQHTAQPVQQPSPPFALAQTFQPSSYNSQQTQPSTKIHQPAAIRARNAIPIVNPSTGMRVASPPQSASPARMQQQTYARRW